MNGSSLSYPSRTISKPRNDFQGKKKKKRKNKSANKPAEDTGIRKERNHTPIMPFSPQYKVLWIQGTDAGCDSCWECHWRNAATPSPIQTHHFIRVAPPG